MIKHLRFLLPVTILALALLVPNLSFAESTLPAQTVGPDGGVGIGNPQATYFQIVPCTGVKKPDGTGNACDFNQLLIGVNRIIKFLLFLSIPLILGMVLYTGFKYVTANGDPGKLADAKKMFIPVALGMFWVLSAYFIVYTVLDKVIADNIGGVDKKNIIFLNINNR